VEDWSVSLFFEKGSDWKKRLMMYGIDVMRGTKLFYHKIYNRLHFDYAILILFLVYAACLTVVIIGKVTKGSCISPFLCAPLSITGSFPGP
jgi:hypothetical protein